MRADQLIEAQERAREEAPRRRGLTPAPAVARQRGPAVVSLSAQRLQPHPRRLRDDLGDLTDLVESIRAQGVLVPLTVERRDTGLVILYGHRRAAAAICAGLDRVPCVVVAQRSDEDAIVAMLAAKERRHLTPAERQRAVAALRDEFGLSMPEIGRRLGISESSAYRWGQGEDAATVRGDRPPRRVDSPKSWGGHRGTRKPRIRADRVWSLVERWREQVAGGLNADQAQALLAEVEDLLQQWHPEPTVREHKLADGEEQS